MVAVTAMTMATVIAVSPMIAVRRRRGSGRLGVLGSLRVVGMLGGLDG